MPAYSFQERFVPMVLDGSKPHTIRNRRKNFAKVGDTLYLYFGMRTKWCKKLREEICFHTNSLSISIEAGIVVYDGLLSNTDLAVAAEDPTHPMLPIDAILNRSDRNRFAWSDGFRPEGTTLENCEGAYELMERFWTQTHSLPWAGDIIYWKP